MSDFPPIPPLMDRPDPKDEQARVAVFSLICLTILGSGLIAAAIVAMLKGQAVEAALWTALGTIVGSIASGLNPPGGVVGALRQLTKGNPNANA